MDVAFSKFLAIVTLLSIRLVARRSVFSEPSERAEGGRHALHCKDGMKQLQRAQRFCGSTMAVDGSRWQFLGRSPTASPRARDRQRFL